MSESSKTKNSRSPIWHYFEPVDVRNTKCLLCESIYRNSGNTTNLIDHLKRKHRAEYYDLSESMKNNQQQQQHQQQEEKVSIEDSEIPAAVEAIHPKLELDSTMEEVAEERLEQEEVPSTEIENDSDEKVKEAQEVQIVKIVPLPHARSEVWNYFGFVANNEGNILDRSKAVCKLCASTFCYSGNTTNFYSHLKSMHSEIQLKALSSTASASTPNIPSTAKSGSKRTYSNMMDDGSDPANTEISTTGLLNNVSGSSNVTYFGDEEPLPERSQDGVVYIEDITKYIIDFLVYDCRPACIVQGKGFQRLLRLLAPGYSLPDKQKLSVAIRKRYEEMRKERESGSVPSVFDGKYSNI